MMNRTIAYVPSDNDVGVPVVIYRRMVEGLVEGNHWSDPPPHLADDLKSIKKALKGHFYNCQSRRCCYCSIELPNHGASIYLDHVISRRDRPDFMLSLNNLGAACGPCNGSKSAKPVLIEGLDVAGVVNVPMDSGAYILVHPQLDEWADHFELDEFSRIRKTTDKGGKTIEMCGIDKLNAARLSDHFASRDRAEVVKVITKVGSYKQRARKQRAIQLLRDLAYRGSDKARVAVARIEMEVI